MLGGTWGGLIAYILVGGEFVHALLSEAIGGSLFTYQLLFLAIGFVVALRGLKFVVRAESFLVAALLMVVVVIVVRASVFIDVQNFLTIEKSSFLLPYGVVLFALGGLDVVPELSDILGKSKKLMRNVVPWSFLVIVLMYAAFAAAVVGVTGQNTTPESIVGLSEVLGPWALILGAVMGILAVATSFILMSVQLQDMLEFDFGYTRLFAWFVTMSVPVIVFLLGARDFIEVMGFTGAVFGGMTGLFVVSMYLQVRKTLCTNPVKCFAIPKEVCYVIIVLFVSGIIIGLI
jgi:amino acid permease